ARALGLLPQPADKLRLRTGVADDNQLERGLLHRGSRGRQRALDATARYRVAPVDRHDDIDDHAASSRIERRARTGTTTSMVIGPLRGSRASRVRAASAASRARTR